MSIGPEYYNENKKYPYLVKEYLGKKINREIDIELIPGSGETTGEALNKLKDIVQRGKRYDFVIFAYGINDALPRGLKRETRGKIIRAMYSLKFNEKMRLFARAYFLNPLEFIMQLVRKPLHYNDINTFIGNVNYILEQLGSLADKKLIYISMNPVLNYRFVNSNIHIGEYNDKLLEVLDKKCFDYINVCKLFSSGRTEKYLADDKFHYSRIGHRAVADEIIKLLDK